MKAETEVIKPWMLRKSWSSRNWKRQEKKKKEKKKEKKGLYTGALKRTQLCQSQNTNLTVSDFWPPEW